MYPREALPKNWNTTTPASPQAATALQWTAVGFVAGVLNAAAHHPGSRRVSKP
jgi:hypothetical protein